MTLTPREQGDVDAALGLAVAPVEPSAGLRDSIMAAVEKAPQVAADSPSGRGRAERESRARWFTRPGTVLLAGAAAVALFLGGAFLGSNVFPQRAADTQAQSLADLSSAPDVQRATAPVAGGGTATLLWSLDQRRSAVLFEALPSLPAGKTYQLWYINAAGSATPAGTFESSAKGTTWRVLDGAMTGGDTVGVTVEPAGGSSKPTTDPLVAIPSS